MFSDLFSTEGRLGRLRYFLYSVTLTAVTIGGVWFLLGPPPLWIRNWIHIVRDPDHTRLIICIAFDLVILRCSASLTMKRLHDVDVSGIFWVLGVMIPLVVDGGAMSIGSRGMMLVAVLLYLALKSALILWPGTEGANSFGAEPH